MPKIMQAKVIQSLSGEQDMGQEGEIEKGDPFSKSDAASVVFA
jgi:hypothetical protein